MCSYWLILEVWIIELVGRRKVGGRDLCDHLGFCQREKKDSNMLSTSELGIILGETESE